MTGEQIAEIVVIDDDELVRDTLRDILEEAGHAVADAADGTSGLQKILNLRPRLVICDVRMPGKNGYEVLKELRKDHPAVSEIPFIFLSGLSEKEYVAAGYKIGADDYMTKPVDLDLLRMKVAAVLRRTDAGTAGAAPTTTAGAAGTKAPFADADAIASEIVGASRGGGATSGSIQLVSLDEFREQFGAEWEKLRDKAVAITESIIRQRLRPNDLYVSYDDDGFLILYRGADEAEAKRRVTALADELRVRLLGEDHASYGHLDISAISVDPATLLGEDGKLDLSRLKAAHEEGRRQAGGVAAGETAAQGTPAWFSQQLSVRYLPVWSAVREAVVAFQCVPVRTTPYGELSGRHVLHGGPTDPWAILVDEFLVQHVAPYFDASSPYSDVAAICLPVHFHALTECNAEILDRSLVAFSPELIRNRLIIQIVGLPEFRGSVNVQRAVQWAKAYSQHVAIQLPPDDRHVAIARSAGAEILHLRIPSAQDADRRSKVLMQVRDQGAQLKRQGLRGMLEDVDLLDQFAAARESGYQFVTGKTIGEAIESPRPPYALPVRKIAG